jgi:hypothetical protein
VALAASCSDGPASDDATGPGSGAGASGSTGSGAAGGTGSGGHGGEANEPLSIDPLGAITLDEETEVSFALPVHGAPDRVFADDLPPGALWDEPTRTFSFRPDFIQAGTFVVTFTATRGADAVDAALELTVEDSVQPPTPAVIETETVGACQRLTLEQVTDDFLGSPGNAGKKFPAVITVPEPGEGGEKVPVTIELHGFGGTANGSLGCSGGLRISPADTENSYWWGYADSLPTEGAPTSGQVVDYTQRRVLALLEWALETYPHADPERVRVTGGSMGGAGALTLGLLHARHFATIDASLAQAIPRNHRPSRIAQLKNLWGLPETDLDDALAGKAWDRIDLTRALRDEREARDQFLFIKHGKDDPTIHFGAVTMEGALTSLSFYEVLESERLGHYAVWDEGAHGPEDPVMGGGWWDAGWSRIGDETAFLRRDLPFPAFSGWSANGDPGDGTGNGKEAWSDESGFAANVGVAGDTGWTGDIAGAFNRFLRWDATKIVDTRDELSIPLRYLDGEGGAAPQEGYPAKGDRYDGPASPTVDVTLRRVRRFQCLPGESIEWQLGDASGTVEANVDGSVTVPGVALTTEWATLELRRAAR